MCMPYLFYTCVYFYVYVTHGSSYRLQDVNKILLTYYLRLYIGTGFRLAGRDYISTHYIPICCSIHQSNYRNRLMSVNQPIYRYRIIDISKSFLIETNFFLPISSNLHCAFNSSLHRQNGRHFADDIFRCIFTNEKLYILIKIWLKFVLNGPIDNNPTLV